MNPEYFKDRAEAGRYLGDLLKEYSEEGPVAVGLPRGGVVVAAEVARALNCRLDLIFAGKLRAPYNPELAIGAVTEDGAAYLNESAVRSLRVGEEYIEKEKKARLQAVHERLKSYRAVKERVPLKGRTVIIVDDGLATGSTMISAIEAAKASGAKKIVVAVPGGPLDTVELIRHMKEVNKVVCPVIPPLFMAVSQIYLDFRQTEDEEVIKILKEFASKDSTAD